MLYYYISTIGYLTFLVAHGVYAESISALQIEKVKAKDPELTIDEMNDISRDARMASFHFPAVLLMLVLSTLLHIGAHEFITLALLGILFSTFGCLLSLKFPPAKRIPQQ
jgi:hypothetical protein